MITRVALCAEALSWLDTPWRHRQCVKGVRGGTDCVRLLEGIAKAVGILDADWQPPLYTQQYHLHTGREMVQEVLVGLGAVAMPLCDRQPGDCLLFQFGRSCGHAALLMPHNRMLHALKAEKRVIQNTLTGDWVTRLRAAYAFPGVQPWA
jgi:cell wall-associated NlpC family hydrolase